MSDNIDKLAVWRTLDKTQWDHPDLKLSKIIIMMASNGFKVGKISEILGISKQILNRFYKRELVNGSAAVHQEIHNKLVSMILAEEDPKRCLKAMEIYYKYNKRFPDDEQEEDPRSTEDSVKSLIDPKKLSLAELRTLTELIKKAPTTQ